MGTTASVLGAVALGLGAALWKLRQVIQGYWFDQRCPSPGAEKDLTGRTVLVTGATVGGLGCAAAEHLARRGAFVVLTCRTAAKAEAAAACIAKASPAGSGGVATLLVDFTKRASIRAAAAEFGKRFTRLDILVLNAGVGGGSADAMWQTNHVGPFMLTEALRPFLEAAAKDYGDARVVAVSSGAHKSGTISETPYESDSPYSQSKLAQIMHMRELQKRVRAAHPALPAKAFRCLAITPGMVGTNIFGEAVKARPLWQRVAITCLQAVIFPVLARSPSMGAEVILMASVDDTLEGGEYLSNCYSKPAVGRDGCANSEEAWEKCWGITERCVVDSRF